MPHFYGFPLDLCGKPIAALFASTSQFGKMHLEKRRNVWIAALYKTAHFRELWRKQTDKCVARYAVLISATAERLLHSFDVYRI